MSKITSRLIALVLLPALLADPAVASALVVVRRPSVPKAVWDTQALEVPVLMVRRLREGWPARSKMTQLAKDLQPMLSAPDSDSMSGIAEDIGVIGLLGVGKQGQRHLKTLIKQGVSVRAVDKVVDASLRAHYPESDRLSLRSGGAAMLWKDPAIKAVIIATPGNTHYDLVKQALIAGKHVLVEKPFTQTVKQAQELVAMAEARHRILMVGHNRFYLPHFQRLKTMVQKGQLGQILAIEGDYLNPFQKYDTTHTALEGLGYHQVYMIQALLKAGTPPRLISVVRSQDRETVGFKLQYGQIPVTIRLDRHFAGPKTRRVVVIGSEFTATFDYSQEPDTTQLDIRPTAPALFDEPELYSTQLLAQLRSQNHLQSLEDAEPSLNHQLRAFLQTLRTGARSPSDGAEAARIVQILENVRQTLGDATAYHVDQNLPAVMLSELARKIHDSLGDRGGIVVVDGAGGVGKSTTVEPLAEFYGLMYPSHRGVVKPLDEFRLNNEACMTLKKRVLGQPLSENEALILKTNGWGKIEPHKPFEDEAELWMNDIIEIGMAQLKILFSLPSMRLTSTLYNANIKRTSVRSQGQTRHVFSPGDVIFVDGKYSNRESLAGYADVHVRLVDTPERIRQRFKQERGSFLLPQDLADHMRYYDLAIWPSWMAYAIATRRFIDIEVNLLKKSVHVLKPTLSEAAPGVVRPEGTEGPSSMSISGEERFYRRIRIPAIQRFLLLVLHTLGRYGSDTNPSLRMKPSSVDEYLSPAIFSAHLVTISWLTALATVPLSVLKFGYDPLMLTVAVAMTVERSAAVLVQRFNISRLRRVYQTRQRLNRRILTPVAGSPRPSQHSEVALGSNSVPGALHMNLERRNLSLMIGVHESENRFIFIPLKQTYSPSERTILFAALNDPTIADDVVRNVKFSTVRDRVAAQLSFYKAVFLAYAPSDMSRPHQEYVDFIRAGEKGGSIFRYGELIDALSDTEEDPFHQLTLEWLARHIQDEIGKKVRILLIGAGSGTVLASINKKFPNAEIVALDLEVPVIQRLLKQDLRVRGVVGHASQALLHGPFDVIIAPGVVRYVAMQGRADLERFVLELRRLIAPNGYILLQEARFRGIPQISDLDDVLRDGPFVVSNDVKSVKVHSHTIFYIMFYEYFIKKNHGFRQVVDAIKAFEEGHRGLTRLMFKLAGYRESDVVRITLHPHSSRPAAAPDANREKSLLERSA